MNSLYANTFNEMEKLWKRRRTKGFLLLTLLVPIISASLISFLQHRIGLFVGIGSSLPVFMLSLFTFALLPLFLSMTAVDSFSGEIAARTLKLVFVRPITRGNVFASKVLALAVCLAAALGLLWIASTVSGWFAPGGDLSGGLLDSLAAYTAAFVSMLAIAMLAVFIAQCFRSTTAAMALIIFIYGASKLLSYIFPKASVWSVFSYTDWYLLWVGNAAPPTKLFVTSVLLLSYCIMTYTAGWILFEKKQL